MARTWAFCTSTEVVKIHFAGNNFADKLWLVEYEITLELELSPFVVPHTWMVASLTKFWFPASAE